MHRRNFLIAAGAATVTRADAAPIRTPQMFGARGDGRTDNTAALQKMLDEGGELHWPAGRYLTGALQVRSRTRILLESGAEIVGMAGQKGVLRIANAEDVSLEAQGAASIYGPPGLTSHCVSLLGAKRTTVRGLRIGGGGASGGGKDALYLGRGQAPCENVRIESCAIHDGRRNAVSVVECFGYVIENCDVSGAKGAPGAGIDVEANTFGTNRNGVIRGNRIHDNQRFGVVVAFGDGVLIENNEVFGNGEAGIAVSAGGAQFQEGVFRPGTDLLAVAVIDPATGRIRAVGGEALEVGTIVSWRSRKGSAPPAEFARQNRLMVIDNGPEGLLLAVDGSRPLRRLSPPSARLGRSLADSSLALRVMAEGQASNVDIYRNRCRGNGGRGEIEVLTSVNVRVRENEVDAGADRAGIFATYDRRLSIVGNRLRGSRASTSRASRGIHVGVSSHLEHRDNRIEDFGYAGIFVNGVAGSYSVGGDVITGCGWLPGGAPLMVANAPG